ADHVVRWSLLPAAQPVALTPDELAKRGPDFLEQEIAQRVASAPQRWTMLVTVANPGDPTADPTEAWPANRRSIEVGTLIAQHVQAERDGPCRDINFDPTVLPDGMRTSDDPFPAARSSAYAKSYDRRTAEAAYYPRTDTQRLVARTNASPRFSACCTGSWRCASWPCCSSAWAWCPRL